MDNKGCLFCSNYDKMPSKLNLGDVFITQTAKFTRVGDGREGNIPLNYCPNCGKELKDNNGGNM